MANSFGQRLQQVFASRGQLCVGLDPSADQLHKWGLPITAAGAEQFCNEVLDSCQDSIGIVKPQVSFFEQFGSVGYASLERILMRGATDGFLVIADAKRGDIGSTMEGYAGAWLAAEAPFHADALTISPFMGPSSLRGTVELALQNAKGLFLLAATSNPEARSLQSATGETGETISSSICSFASEFNQDRLGSIGVVIGSTVNLDAMGLNAVELAKTPILAPGFGAQGSKLSDVRDIFGELAESVIYNVARSVAGDSPVGLKDRVVGAKLELERGLSR